jgi:uncharacterized protein HemX
MIHGIVRAVVQIVAGSGGGPAGLALLALAIAAAGGTVGAACVNYENAGHQAKAKRYRASEETDQADIDRYDELVQEIINRMTTRLRRWGDIQEQVTGTLAERNYQTARVKFA